MNTSMIFAIPFIILALVNYNNNEKNDGSSFKSSIVTNIWIDEDDLDTFKDNNVGMLLVDIGDTGKDGKILTNRTEINDFLHLVWDYEEENNIDFTLLPYSEVYTNDFAITREFADNFVKEYEQLNLRGFDGTYIDIEPVKPEIRKQYLDLLRELKEKMPNKILGVYAGGWGDPKENEWEWNYSLFEQVSRYSDFIVVPLYDSGIIDANEYEGYVRKQIEEISSREWRNEFFIAIPSHKCYPETMDNSLSISLKEMNKGERNNIEGISLFSSWTMKTNDWKAYNNFIENMENTAK